MSCKQITQLQALDYELKSHVWLGKISNKYLQNIIGFYFGRKVQRKYRNYLYNNQMEKETNEILQSITN